MPSEEARGASARRSEDADCDLRRGAPPLESSDPRVKQLFRPESSVIERQQLGLHARLSPVSVTVVLPDEMVKERKIAQKSTIRRGPEEGVLCKLVERRDYKLNEIQLFTIQQF